MCLRGVNEAIVDDNPMAMRIGLSTLTAGDIALRWKTHVSGERMLLPFWEMGILVSPLVIT
jgi:hypothetical protein